MIQNQLTLEDFAAGFAGDVQGQELLKAMQAGAITGRDTADQALTMEPLKPESLERTLKSLEFRLKDIKMMNLIPKMTAYNTVEEFIQLYSYGLDAGGFYDEGALSDVQDSQYIRRSELVKYMQITGSVTMQAQMVRSFVNAMTQEVENKMKWILRLANRSLGFADAGVVPQQFNGIYAQHASVGSGGNQIFFWPTLDAYFNDAVVVDKRGKSLTQNDLENAAITVDDNFGDPTDFFGPPKIISTLAQDFYNDQRIIQNASDGYKGVIGTVPKAISTSIGDIALNGDKSLKASLAKTSSTAADPNGSPTAVSAITSVALVSDSTAKYVTTTDNPSSLNVFYAVAAVNSKGESVLTISSTAIVLATAFSVDITFPSANGATGYTIYRTLPTANGSPTGLSFYPIFKVGEPARAAGFNGGAAGVVRDKGYFLPNCEQGFVTQWDEEVVSLKQLAPISKLDLAVISMSRQFIVFLFATPNLYAPKKLVRFINCAKTLNP